jgi:CBS domain-containing protein
LTERRIGEHTHAARQTLGDDEHMNTTELKSFEISTVADAMTTGLVSCPPETPLREVARLMATNGVHAVFVFDDDQSDETGAERWGLVSDLDLAAAAWAGIDTRTAGESTVTPLVVVSADDPLERAAQLMAERGTAHLAVLDPCSRRPVSVISTLDIARAISENG